MFIAANITACAVASISRLYSTERDFLVIADLKKIKDDDINTFKILLEKSLDQCRDTVVALNLVILLIIATIITPIKYGKSRKFMVVGAFLLYVYSQLMGGRLVLW